MTGDLPTIAYLAMGFAALAALGLIRTMIRDRRKRSAAAERLGVVALGVVRRVAGCLRPSPAEEGRAGYDKRLAELDAKRRRRALDDMPHDGGES